jgi:hypothetical protein
VRPGPEHNDAPGDVRQPARRVRQPARCLDGRMSFKCSWPAARDASEQGQVRLGASDT